MHKPPERNESKQKRTQKPPSLSIFFLNKSRFYPISIRLLSPRNSVSVKSKTYTNYSDQYPLPPEWIGVKSFPSLSLSLFDQPVPYI